MQEKRVDYIQYQPQRWKSVPTTLSKTQTLPLIMKSIWEGLLRGGYLQQGTLGPPAVPSPHPVRVPHGVKWTTSHPNPEHVSFLVGLHTRNGLAICSSTPLGA